MAGLAVKYTDNVTRELQKLAAIFPDLGKEMLGRLGHQGTIYLRKELLSGQEITLKKASDEIPLDFRGHRMVRHTVNKRGTHAKIYSYPVNLFEKGRGLPGGGREAGRYIITRKLKAIMQARAQADATNISSKTLESHLKRMGF
jgi:hypothetical protein